MAVIPPALFRTSDIGVSAEWRDISYDWLPVLTKHGVLVYSYLRDTYDHQRNLRPFLIHPEGPTKQHMQTLLGLETDFALQGPEFLLATVGLVHVEVGYHASLDPERPSHTHVAFYTVGRLDQPLLDWTMLERVLDAVSTGRDAEPHDATSIVRRKRADAALRTLSQAGFLQNCEPRDLFYPYGAWPQLLPRLVEDQRWAALFAALHGPAAVATYADRAFGWVAATERQAARLMDEHRRIGDLVITAQHRGPHPAPGWNRAADARASQAATGPAVDGAVTRGTPPVQLTHRGFVPGTSLPCPSPLQLSAGGSGTSVSPAERDALPCARDSVPGVSLHCDPLTNQSRWVLSDSAGQRAPTTDGAGRGQYTAELPDARYLVDAELTTTRQDSAFWCAVNQILHGVPGRYAATAAEKKAAQRQFQQQGIPIGIILAALRAAMTLPPAEQPGSFGAALKLPRFQAAVHQALAALGGRSTCPAGAHGWETFFLSYRTVGMAQGLRNVSPPDYQVLQGLFAQHPAACWEVLSRIEHAAVCPDDLSPRYLQRALLNNRREMAELGRGPSAPRETRLHGCAQDHRMAPDDPRRVLLQSVGLEPDLLEPGWTEGYITAWIAEAEQRRPGLRSPRGWLRWGLLSGWLPAEHPDLRPVSSAPLRAPEPCIAESTVATQDAACAPARLRALWSAVLALLEPELPPSEFATWLKQTRLIDLSDDGAIVGTPHIFAREALEQRYVAILQTALAQKMGYPIAVRGAPALAPGARAAPRAALRAAAAGAAPGPPVAGAHRAQLRGAGRPLAPADRGAGRPGGLAAKPAAASAAASLYGWRSRPHRGRPQPAQ